MRCEPDRLLNNAAKGVTGVTPFAIWQCLVASAICSWVTLFALSPLPVSVGLLGGQWRLASLLETAEPEAQARRQD